MARKFYSLEHRRIIDLERDGCDLRYWDEQYGRALFARHPKGFLVFLAPQDLTVHNEYGESDPYTVEQGIESAFHRRRIDCTQELVGQAIKHMQDIPRILDMGCGQGHITARIRQAYHIDISGLDYSISAIEYAVDHFPGIDFVVANAYETPYACAYFDIVVCNNLWEHVPDPLRLLNEISRIMKPWGYLIISTPSRYRLGNLVRVLLGRPTRLISEHHVTEYSVGQVLEQLRYGGYETVRTFSRAIKPNTLIAKLVKPAFLLAISLTRSHSQLEDTVFYLARQVRSSSEPGV